MIHVCRTSPNVLELKLFSSRLWLKKSPCLDLLIPFLTVDGTRRSTSTAPRHESRRRISIFPRNGGFLSHGGTPSYHPFLDGIFHEITNQLLYTPMTSWKPPSFSNGEQFGVLLRVSQRNDRGDQTSVSEELLVG